MTIIHATDVKNIEDYLEKGCVVVTWQGESSSDIIQYEHEDETTGFYYGKWLTGKHKGSWTWFDPGNIELIIKEK